MSNAEVLSKLQLLAWRNIVVPCTAAPYEFSHSQAGRSYPYVDGAGHDWTGMNAIPFSATLKLLNGIRGGPWYPTKWIPLREALFDGKPGPLVHPDLGLVQAVVMKGSVDLRAEMRDGIVVDVSWESHIDDPTAGVAFDGPEISVKALAEACDFGMAGLTPPMAFPTGNPFTSLAGAIAQIEGLTLSVSLTVTGAINQVLGILNDLIGTVSALNDHSAWATQANLTSLFAQLRRLKTQAESLVQRPTAKKTAQRDTTLDALSTETGNTSTELAGLNLELLRSPIVPKGSIVTYYT